ncbi:MAG: NUDIX domain-containing protein [Thermomicrobiales bacterium]|nr:NUDIX domain-containing protein [Thermomicrobiales bacterium]
MTDPVPGAPSAIERDFTVAVFVVHDGAVLLHLHRKLGRWLPPGGHIEPGELPDDAALREVLEETGVVASLVGDPSIDVNIPGQPRQLCRPAGIQLADIRPGHQHIDLVYLATGSRAAPRDGVGWFRPDEWEPLALTDEVAAWCMLAIERLAGITAFNHPATRN